jgi:hypothetical protein
MTVDRSERAGREVRAKKRDEKLSKSPAQIRARARRRSKELNKEIARLHKPVDEWDNEELARGRPRNKNGNFTGRIPDWITPEMCVAARKRFKDEIIVRMTILTTPAVKVLKDILNNDDEDEHGRPVVSAQTKVDITKFLLEHLIGKPKQEITGDLSIQLQAMLGAAIVNPDGQPSSGYTELPPGDDEDDEYEDED